MSGSMCLFLVRFLFWTRIIPEDTPRPTIDIPEEGFETRVEQLRRSERIAAKRNLTMRHVGKPLVSHTMPVRPKQVHRPV